MTVDYVLMKWSQTESTEDVRLTEKYPFVTQLHGDALSFDALQIQIGNANGRSEKGYVCAFGNNAETGVKSCFGLQGRQLWGNQVCGLIL